MKRDERLADLSREHYDGLVLGRRAVRTAEAAEPGALEAGALLAVWTEVRGRFEADLEPHFRDEELALFPPLAAAGGGALVDRALADHAALRALAAHDVEPTAERLRELGERLTRHIRFEERELFPEAERRLEPAALDAVAQAVRARRARS